MLIDLPPHYVYLKIRNKQLLVINYVWYFGMFGIVNIDCDTRLHNNYSLDLHGLQTRVKCSTPVL